MYSSAQKKEETQSTPTQYSRLQKLLNFRFFEKASEATPTETPADDFIDIVLEADFSSSGKVKNVR